MAGIYVHIPFCRTACHYCDFHFVVGDRDKTRMVQAIGAELKLRQSEISEPITTLYFGGGTPSQLSTEELRYIITRVQEHYEIEQLEEVTLEANPDDITPEKLSQWKALGINRLSMGIQSFFQKHLTWMNRAHNAEQAVQALHWAKQEGFEDITLDLIYGLPDMNMDEWKENIQKAVEFQIPHLSCYALTVENNTRLKRMVEQGKVVLPEDEIVEEQFAVLIRLLKAGGYEHYEISNFARPGRYAKHNTSYWEGTPYLGIGPSAHSFKGNTRSWNVANNQHYCSALEEGKRDAEFEQLTLTDQLNEFILTRLRTQWGMSKQVLEQKFGQLHFDRIDAQMKPFVDKGLVEDGACWRLTPAGKFQADGIASDLFHTTS